MNYYLKQNFLTWGERFAICDESARNRFFVDSELFAVGKVLRLCTLGGNQIAEIKQKAWSLTPAFRITREGKETVTLSMSKRGCRAKGQGLLLSGDLSTHIYDIKDKDGKTLCTVSKKWFTLGDAHGIEIIGDDPDLYLSMILATEAWLDRSDKKRD